jgi:hypothetical protein
MASDITSTSEFTTGNMKPVSGEIIDSVWGQKMAENTGYLFFNRPHMYVSFSNSEKAAGGVLDGANGTLFFAKTSHSLMQGTVSLTADGSSNDLLVYVNGTEIVSESFINGKVNVGISYDISSLTEGQVYELGWNTDFFTGGASVRTSSVSLWGTTA